MALTAYCKKCRREVDAGELCPFCGTRLGKTAAHAAWCMEKIPVRDWMSWNAVMRVLLPSALAVLLIVLAAEGLSGGTEALERLIGGGFLTVLGILLAAVLAIVGLLLGVQGKELTDYVVDSRGVHETRYLPNPTPMKLLARLKSPALMSRVNPEAAVPVLKLEERHLSWRETARVQLWPEKCMILFYAPAWWLRVSAACTPLVWEDVMGLIREKLGRKKKIRLPASLVAPPAPPRRKTKPMAPLVPEVEEAIEQLRMEELAERPPVPAEAPEQERPPMPAKEPEPEAWPPEEA